MDLRRLWRQAPARVNLPKQQADAAPACLYSSRLAPGANGPRHTPLPRTYPAFQDAPIADAEGEWPGLGERGSLPAGQVLIIEVAGPLAVGRDDLRRQRTYCVCLVGGGLLAFEGVGVIATVRRGDSPVIFALREVVLWQAARGNQAGTCSRE